MSDKREIKSYSTASLMSLAVHALVLILIVIFSRASFKENKIVVIDLTLIDPVTADAGVVDNKKVNYVYVPKRKLQETVAEDVEPKTVQKKQEMIEEKEAVAEAQVTRVPETSIEEKMPAVRTVSLVQDIEQNYVPRDQGMNKHAGTLLNEEGGSGTKAEREAGNSAGTTESVMKGYIRSHLSDIKKMIQKNISYPETARREGWMGKVKISFVIANNGRAKDIKVVQSSGFKILDKSAEEAVSRSSPFPHPPVEARIIIPILYTLH